MLLNGDDDTFLQTFNCLFFFLMPFVVLFVQFLMKLHLRCVYMKDYTRVKLSNILTMVLQEKAYSVSGCDLFSKWS